MKMNRRYLVDVLEWSFQAWMVASTVICGFLTLYYGWTLHALISIIFMSSVIYFVRIPPPPSAIVEEVIGVDPLHEENHPDKYVMKVIAHRGAAMDAPENSLVAFQLCADKGCSAIELDVQMTKDGVAIVFHDCNLERMGNIKKNVIDMTYEEISQVDISVNHPFKDKFGDTRIPKLEDAISLILKNRQRVIIDIKHYNDKIIKEILKLYEKYPNLARLAVCSSFYPRVIYGLRRANPNIVASLAWCPLISAVTPTVNREHWVTYILCSITDVLLQWMIPRIIYFICGISLVLANEDTINSEVVAQWRLRGVRLVAWTVNHPLRKQYFTKVLHISYITDTLSGEISVHSK